MKIEDSGILISIKNFAEEDGLIKIFSQEHGVVSGIVKSLKSVKKRFIYQIGNKIEFVWRARLAEHIGNITAEVEKNYFALFMEDKLKINITYSICFLLSNLLPEMHSEPKLYQHLENFLKILQGNNKTQILREYIFFEMELLALLGYGLDLSECAVSGAKENLSYISPKTGKAVTDIIGNPYKDKLFELPKFIINKQEETDLEKLSLALQILDFFLNKVLNKYKSIDLCVQRKELKIVFEKSLV